MNFQKNTENNMNLRLTKPGSEDIRKNYSLFFFFEIVSINVAKTVTITIIKVIAATGYCGKASKKFIFRIFFLSMQRNVLVFYRLQRTNPSSFQTI